MNKTKYIVIIIFFALAANSQSNIEIKKLLIFTDGNSYVVKEGIINTSNKSFSLEKDQLPIPRFGTLFINASDESLKYVSSKKIETIENPLNKSINSVLSNNMGKRIEIKTNDETFIGIIFNVIPGYLIINSDQQTIIKIEDILSFKFIDKLNFDVNPNPSTIKKNYDNYGRGIKDDNRNAKIILHFDSDGRKNIHLSYLQKGISWNPNYRLNLKDNNKAILRLQAEIINDIDNLKDADVELIVGKPNFQYHEYLTDLIDYNNTLDPFYEKPKNNSNYYSSGMMLDEVVIISKNKAESKFHDFQIYNLNNVNLEKNSRALFNIFEYEIPYKHIYECELQTQDFNKSYNSNNINNNDEINIVFHSIQIENTTNSLLGKGSVFIFDDIKKNSRPIAQSKMTFIPESARGTVKLTENNEIEISSNEKIVKRQEQEIEFWGRDYYKAEIHGTIKIINYNKQKIELHINSEINGELKGNNAELEVINQKQPFHSPNYFSKVKWVIDLNARETKEINYKYEVFVK